MERGRGDRGRGSGSAVRPCRPAPAQGSSAPDPLRRRHRRGPGSTAAPGRWRAARRRTGRAPRRRGRHQHQGVGGHAEYVTTMRKKVRSPTASTRVRRARSLGHRRCGRGGGGDADTQSRRGLALIEGGAASAPTQARTAAALPLQMVTNKKALALPLQMVTNKMPGIQAKYAIFRLDAAATCKLQRKLGPLR